MTATRRHAASTFAAVAMGVGAFIAICVVFVGLYRTATYSPPAPPAVTTYQALPGGGELVYDGNDVCYVLMGGQKSPC